MCAVVGIRSATNTAVLRSIEEGEFFFFQGDPATYFYVLVTGRAKLLQTSPAGQQVNLRTINEWQMFGALGAVREEAKVRDAVREMAGRFPPYPSAGRGRSAPA